MYRDVGERGLPLADDDWTLVVDGRTEGGLGASGGGWLSGGRQRGRSLAARYRYLGAV